MGRLSVLRRTAGHSRLTGLPAGTGQAGWLTYGCYNVHVLWCTL
jgi:hypothetical protein